VSSVLVDIGDRVKAGQLLVQLADHHLQVEVEEARAEIAALERTIEVERVTVELERMQIQSQGPEDSARIAAARAKAGAVLFEVQNARRNHTLQSALHSNNRLVSDEAVRSALSDLRAAEARFEEAQANASAAAQSVQQVARIAHDAVTIRTQRIAVYEAQRLAARARLERARGDVASAAIRAPGNGAIVRRIAEPGMALAAGQPVLSMWLGDELWVDAWIDEDDLAFVRRGTRATVTFNSFRGREFTGVVDRIGLATDLEVPDADVPQPRFSRMSAAPVVSVRIRLDKPPPELRPGLSAIVAIEKKRDAQ
jgi:multidrug resistance efflux pump